MLGGGGGGGGGGEVESHWIRMRSAATRKSAKIAGISRRAPAHCLWQPPAANQKPPATSRQPPATSHQPPAAAGMKVVSMQCLVKLVCIYNVRHIVLHYQNRNKHSREVLASKDIVLRFFNFRFFYPQFLIIVFFVISNCFFYWKWPLNSFRFFSGAALRDKTGWWYPVTLTLASFVRIVSSSVLLIPPIYCYIFNF